MKSEYVKIADELNRLRDLLDIAKMQATDLETGMMTEWINPEIKPPPNDVFWALIKGRNEITTYGIFPDYEIILLQESLGEYRTLDEAGSYSIDAVHWCSKIYGWLPYDAITTKIQVKE